MRVGMQHISLQIFYALTTFYIDHEKNPQIYLPIINGCLIFHRFTRRNHTFPKVLKTFFLVLPAAVLRAVEICMEQTDPRELSHLVVSNNSKNKINSYCETPNSDSQNTENKDQVKFENKFVPLTEARIQFLIRLMHQVKLPV